MSTFLCSLRPGPAAAGLLEGLFLYGDRLIVAHEEKQLSVNRCVVGLALGIGASTGLRGIGPSLAGNVGASWAFALSREGDQDVDVPMLAPARSRCRRSA